MNFPYFCFFTVKWPAGHGRPPRRSAGRTSVVLRRIPSTETNRLISSERMSRMPVFLGRLVNRILIPCGFFPVLGPDQLAVPYRVPDIFEYLSRVLQEFIGKVDPDLSEPLHVPVIDDRASACRDIPGRSRPAASCTCSLKTGSSPRSCRLRAGRVLSPSLSCHRACCAESTNRAISASIWISLLAPSESRKSVSPR